MLLNMHHHGMNVQKRQKPRTSGASSSATPSTTTGGAVASCSTARRRDGSRNSRSAAMTPSRATEPQGLSWASRSITYAVSSWAAHRTTATTTASPGDASSRRFTRDSASASGMPFAARGPPRATIARSSAGRLHQSVRGPPCRASRRRGTGLGRSLSALCLERTR